MVREEGIKSAESKRDIVLSSVARRRKTSVFGSRRWWKGGCWSTRSHQEAYLRKLYSKSYPTPGVNLAEDSSLSGENNVSVPSLWDPVEFEMSSSHKQTNVQLQNRKDAVNSNVVLFTPCTSPTEKCVDFLNRSSDESSGDCSRHLTDHVLEETDAWRVTEQNLDSLLQRCNCAE